MNIVPNLARADIVTIGDLVQKSDYDLLHLDYFGKKSLQRVDDKLAELGLRRNRYVKNKSDSEV